MPCWDYAVTPLQPGKLARRADCTVIVLLEMLRQGFSGTRLRLGLLTDNRHLIVEEDLQMIDIDLIVQALRVRGHSVGNVISVPENAGEYELYVDGSLLSLKEALQLLETAEPAR